MAGSDDRRLLMGGGVAVVVLVVGALAWFGAGGEAEPPPVQVPAGAAERKLGSTDPATSVDGKAAPPSAARRRSAAAMMAAGKDPRVRPEAMSAAVYEDLKAAEPGFQACYASELKTRPDAKGRAMLQLTIDERSEVKTVDVELRGIPSVPLKDCLLNTAQAVVFGRVDQATHAVWPLVMWPDKGLSVQAPLPAPDGD